MAVAVACREHRTAHRVCSCPGTKFCDHPRGCDGCLDGRHSLTRKCHNCANPHKTGYRLMAGYHTLRTFIRDDSGGSVEV